MLVSGVGVVDVASGLASSVGAGAGAGAGAVVAGGGVGGRRGASAAGSCGPHPAARAAIASNPAAVEVAARRPCLPPPPLPYRPRRAYGRPLSSPYASLSPSLFLSSIPAIPASFWHPSAR